VLDRLNKIVILSEPSVKSKFEELGVQPIGGTLAQANSFITREPAGVDRETGSGAHGPHRDSKYGC